MAAAVGRSSKRWRSFASVVIRGAVSRTMVERTIVGEPETVFARCRYVAECVGELRLGEELMDCTARASESGFWENSTWCDTQ